ncbi:MAG TPA: hypothetical protein VHC86_08020 [Opitutaceae bacterium]|nr:hypothetical protein [Opitutaceae bacterium]
MELQHLVVKIPVEGSLGIDPAKVVDFFHPWVAKQAVPGVVLVDVAELLHVPKGPGVVAVGVEADYAFDHSDGVWGVLYRRKDVVKGTNAERVSQALGAATQAAAALEAGFPGLKFSRKEFELIVNDRAIAPNLPATYAAALPEIEKALKELLGHGDFKLARHDQEPRQRFGVTVTSAKPFAFAEAIAV